MLSKIVKIVLVFNAFVVGINPFAQAQFAPQVGQPGTTAIHKDSSVIQAWAKQCVLKRGWQNIADTTLGLALVGDESYVVGPAANGIASLGDGGEAIVSFEKPIKNGPGPDFVVFENGFIDQTLKPGTAFLELAFVEVSNDGVKYVRFPAQSYTDTSLQCAAFDGLDASKMHNLAGKYIANYGTPFDLDELVDSLDVSQINYVKIIDVVGAVIPQYASRDKHNKIINDPWPTAFAQSGFDLDAIGVIHQNDEVGLFDESKNQALTVYPNPVAANQVVHIGLPNTLSGEWILNNAIGKEIQAGALSHDNKLLLNISENGVYFLNLKTPFGYYYKTILVK